MSTRVPGFQSSLSFFASFCIGQISHKQHEGKEEHIFLISKNPFIFLTNSQACPSPICCA